MPDGAKRDLSTLARACRSLLRALEYVLHGGAIYVASVSSSS